VRLKVLASLHEETADDVETVFAAIERHAGFLLKFDGQVVADVARFVRRIAENDVVFDGRDRGEDIAAMKRDAARELVRFDVDRGDFERGGREIDSVDFCLRELVREQDRKTA